MIKLNTVFIFILLKIYCFHGYKQMAPVNSKPFHIVQVSFFWCYYAGNTAADTPASPWWALKSTCHLCANATSSTRVRGPASKVRHCHSNSSQAKGSLCQRRPPAPTRTLQAGGQDSSVPFVSLFHYLLSSFHVPHETLSSAGYAQRLLFYRKRIVSSWHFVSLSQLCLES